MQVIDYFESDRQSHWLDEIKRADWGAAAFLHELLTGGTFFETVGERSKVLLLTDGDELISFCTYAEKDDIRPTDLTPWMGFVYTFPARRGHRYVGLLMDAAERLAQKDGVPKIYISTNHVGLYEKYGCEFMTEMNDMNKEPSRVYVKHVGRPQMTLRDFKKEDAKTIASWIRTEEELYKWSADRFNKFPLSGDDINQNYAPQIETGRFFPLTAADDKGNVVGHFIIRYPKADDDSSVRFGFVIVDPAHRGKGCGKEMLRLGTEYVKKHRLAVRIDLGVFANNDGARHCYEAAGFKAYGERECEMPIGTWKCIDMEMFV